MECFIDKTFIEQELQKWKEHLDKKYGLNKIAYIALYGSQNYHLSTKKSDVDVKAIYIPTIEESIFNEKKVSETIVLESGAHCEVKDIREMNKMFLKQNTNFLEILFTDYYWINPIYKNQIEIMRSNAEAIAFCNKEVALFSILGQTKRAVKDYTFKKNKDLKYLAKIFFFFCFLEKYENAVCDYKNCLLAAENTPSAEYGSIQNLILTLKSGKVEQKEIEEIEKSFYTIRTYLHSKEAEWKKEKNKFLNTSPAIKEVLNTIAFQMIMK